MISVYRRCEMKFLGLNRDDVQNIQLFSELSLHVEYVSVCFYQTVWNYKSLKGQQGVPGLQGSPGVPGEQGRPT